MLHTPNPTHITLPNLSFFEFGGVSAYLEALLSHMNAPLLKRLSAIFFNQLSFSVPHLSQFVTTAENIRFNRVDFLFRHKTVAVFMYFSLSASIPTLDIHVDCEHLDWQVSSITQILKFLSPLFSTVVDLRLDYRSHTPSSDRHDQADYSQWRELLGSFRGVQTLRVHDGLVGELSRCLTSDGEPASAASEILPELNSLVCPIGSHGEKTFAKFAHDREVAGLPIELIEEVFPKHMYEFSTAAGMEYVN